MSLAELCVRRPVFATMLVMFLVVLGGFAFMNLGVDLFPKADAPVVNVNVSLPGASPDEVTTQIIMPIEEQISAISGLDEMTSMASEGFARITCRFVLERDVEGAAQDVREKVALAMRQLPDNVQPPIITKADPDSDPVITLAIGGSRSLRDITEIADKLIKRQLQTVDGVASIDMSGGRAREIRVLLDAERLSAHHITVNQVARSLQSENIESPGGRIIQGASELAVRTVGRLTAVEQFKNLVVETVQKAPVKVSDLGTVEDAYAEPRSFTWLDGVPAVTLPITRQSGSSTVKVVDDVRKKLSELSKTLPSDIKVQVVSDQSVFIRASVAALEEHLILGGLLASMIIFLFIRNWRAVLISSLAIPASIISTFSVIKLFNFSLNNMTLLALTLAVGLVIDDAIVVLENIFRHMEELRSSPMKAAIDGTKEISLAVVSTTLSLVIIFVPIAFMTGYAQRYLNSFGLTMTFAILVSMLISFTLTPMLSSRFLHMGPGSASLSKQTRFFTVIEHAYERLLDWSLRHPWTVIGVSALVFLSVFPLNRMVGRDFIPNDDQGEFTIHADTPEGTSLEGAMDYARRIYPELKKIPGVEHVLALTAGRVTHIHFIVELESLDKRKDSMVQIAAVASSFLNQLPRFQYKLSFPNALGGGDAFGTSIQVQILGPELERVAELSRRATDELRVLPGIAGALPNLSLSNPELRVAIDRDRAADLGVKASDMAATVRLLMSGEDQITTYREAGEEYPVKVVLQSRQREDRDIMARLMVPSSVSGQVRLDSVAQITRGLGPATLSRFNRQFSVSLAILNAPSRALGDAVKDTETTLRHIGFPPGYSYRFTGTVKALDETTNNLIMAFLLAVIFMYMVLAAQFESFLHPFIIMLALPLSVPMALLSLHLTGRTLNLWSALGVLLLLGIVKKNAILQVDYTNRLRARGVELREAIIQADRARLRPILMTTFSIIAGLIPTAFGSGAGSAQRSAIAVTIIGGQMLCLLLTLLLTPVAYELLAKRRLVESDATEEDVAGMAAAFPPPVNE